MARDTPSLTHRIMSNPYTYSKTAIHPEWHTPPELMTRFTDFLGRDGRPVIDYASSIEACHPGFDCINTPDGIIEVFEGRYTKPCSTSSQRGSLLMDNSSFFLNPPGSRDDVKLKYEMFKTLVNRVFRDPDSELILLVYSINSLPIYTDLLPRLIPSGWGASVCLVRKRIQFIPSSNNPSKGKSALAQNALLYLGQRPWDFRDTFSDLGMVFSNP